MSGKNSSLIPHPSSFRLGLLCALVYVVLAAIAFPPFNQAWAVLVFLTPFIKWSFARPRWRTYLLSAFLGGSGAWFVILIWLRHIEPPFGLLGLAILSAYLGLYSLAWLAAMRWAAPRLDGAARWRRLLGLFALAGWWVVLDWVRGWLFTGFAWLPLAAAFWKFPLFLQPLAWTGTWSVTLAIVLFNLGLVCGTGREPLPDGEPPRARKIFWPTRLGPELMAPILLFIGAVLLASSLMHSKARENVPLVRVGIVQPATPPLLKSTLADQQANWEALQSLSQIFQYHDRNPNNVDFVLWPESAPPFFVQGPGMDAERALLQKFATMLGRPILMGGVGLITGSPGNPAQSGAVDGVFYVRPGPAGFAKEFYAKRHLVPFGEYNPLPSSFPFNSTVVKVIGDASLVPGERPIVIPMEFGDDRLVKAGPLVCYEDVFPELSRDEVKAGADMLVVVTDDAWFGTGGGSIQHAAHSVLRAIETRRPVLRCGDEGWSGFIDQDGDAFELEKVGNRILSEWVLRANGTTYFKGSGALIVYTNPQFDGVQTFYVRHGDWFVGLSALLVATGLLALLWWRQPVDL